MHPRQILGLLAAAAITASACGGGPTSEATVTAATDLGSDAAAPDAESDSESGAETPASEEAGENELPVVDVVDLATGDSVNLASFAPAGKPIVLWFWAPF